MSQALGRCWRKGTSASGLRPAECATCDPGKKNEARENWITPPIARRPFEARTRRGGHRQGRPHSNERKGQDMSGRWAAIDAGTRTHHCVLINREGTVVLPTKVANEEADLRDVIAWAPTSCGCTTLATRVNCSQPPAEQP